MKKIITLVILITYINTIYSQNLTLSNIENICSKANWDNANQYLMNKNWEYYESKKGESEKHKTITWSFNKSPYENSASAWFYLFTYKGLPSEIGYSVFNKKSYSLIIKTLTSKGYKRTNSTIDNNEINTTYENNKFILEINTKKRVSENSAYSNESFTAYNFSLIRKGGIYDFNNGKKKVYWDETDKIKIEYTLKNGKYNGVLTSYYYNENINKIESYRNGIKNGVFKEYNKSGKLLNEYYMKNETLNNTFKVYYDNGQIKRTGNYINGKKNGIFLEYGANGKISDFKTYKLDFLNGKFQTYDENYILRKTGYYLNGKENGKFEEYNKNGLISARFTMKNNKFNGIVTIYENNKKTEEILYKEGFKNGFYTYYVYDNNSDSLRGFLKTEYLNDKKNGKETLTRIENGEEKILSYQYYIQGIKDGSFREVREDTLVFGSYKNGKLSGKYKVFKDVNSSFFGRRIGTDTLTMIIKSRGYYNNGLKTGKWKYYHSTDYPESEGSYLNGKKTGIWKYYYTWIREVNNRISPFSGKLKMSETYKNGLLNGEVRIYSRFEETELISDTIENNITTKDTISLEWFVKKDELFTYKDDILHGKCIIKDTVGTVTFEGSLKNGEKDGLWLESSGDIFEKGDYINGKRNGVWKEYFDDNNIFRTTTYSYGKLEGKQVEYFSDIKYISYYKKDKITEVTVYDSTLTDIDYQLEPLQKDTFFIVKKTNYMQNMVIVGEYWMPRIKITSGSLFCTIHSDFAYPDGEFKYFNKKNKLLAKGYLYKDNKISIWIYNYQEQNIKMEINYNESASNIEKYYFLDTNELYKGIFNFYDNETGIKEIRKIKDGVRNGTTTFIDKNGEKIKKEKYKDGILR